MASTLYLHLPSRAVATSLEKWSDLNWPYCLANDKQVLESGQQSLSSLALLSGRVQRLVLLLSAADVSFFALKVPPIPYAKLKLALPNLLEEQVLSDPTELLFVPSLPQHGICAVAVVSRDWMEQVLQAVAILGIPRVSAYSQADVLIAQAERAVVYVETAAQTDAIIEIGVKPPCSEQGGEEESEQQARLARSLPLGMSLDLRSLPDPAQRNEAIQQALQILVPDGSLKLHLDASLQAQSSALLQANPEWAAETELQKLDWPTRIAGMSASSLDLSANLKLEGKSTLDWRRWRWSVILASLICFVGVLALNLEAWKLQREYTQIRQSMLASYRATFPKEPGLQDPLLQMQQKVNAARKLTGQSSQDDFLVLSAQFAQVWDLVQGAQMTATVAQLEYREKSLWVTPKAGTELQVDRLRQALQEKSLHLEVKEGVLKVTVVVGGGR